MFGKRFCSAIASVAAMACLVTPTAAAQPMDGVEGDPAEVELSGRDWTTDANSLTLATDGLTFVPQQLDQVPDTVVEATLGVRFTLDPAQGTADDAGNATTRVAGASMVEDALTVTFGGATDTTTDASVTMPAAVTADLDVTVLLDVTKVQDEASVIDWVVRGDTDPLHVTVPARADMLAALGVETGSEQESDESGEHANAGDADVADDGKAEVEGVSETESDKGPADVQRLCRRGRYA